MNIDNHGQDLLPITRINWGRICWQQYQLKMIVFSQDFISKSIIFYKLDKH